MDQQQGEHGVGQQVGRHRVIGDAVGEDDGRGEREQQCKPGRFAIIEQLERKPMHDQKCQRGYDGIAQPRDARPSERREQQRKARPVGLGHAASGP